MARTVTAVIGANFGDEGKGLMTDHLAALDPFRTLVVRANGGAQAGHTVCSPQGRRHVFSHVGSGAMSGAPTLLSRFFISNPLLLDKEWPAIADLAPRILADPKGVLTTPFDMLVNQLVERARGQGRHGSCGMGFNETLERSQHADFRLELGALSEPRSLTGRLRDIRRYYLPRRLESLGVETDATFRDLLASEALLADFLEACRRFIRRVRLEPDTEALNRFDHVLFEGAQGLLLDEEHPWFPHVTRSKTGLKNIASLMREASLEALHAVFVTRWYMTRHGAGPFPTEVAGKPAPGIEDRTNLANDWQGSLRFGLLDLPAFGDTLRQELAQPLGVAIEASLAVTCLDQADECIPFRAPQASAVRSAAFPALMRDHTHLEVAFRSYGPTRRDILVSPLINAA